MSEVDQLFERYGAGYKWLATATVMLGTLSMVMATTIINVAIPEIRGTFGLGQDQVQWLSTGYLAAMTATMLANAWCVEALGQRRTYMTAMMIFVFCSFLGGLSPNAELLTLARVGQGAMAGIIQPLAAITIFQVFPPNERGRGMGIYGLGVILGPAIGPTLGGVLVDLFNWRAVFFLAPPFCVLGFLMATAFMPRRMSEDPPPRFDFFGFGLLCAALVMILWGLSNGPRHGWDSVAVEAALAGGVLSGFGFVLRSLLADHPVLNLRVFTNPGFLSGSLVAFLLGAGLFGSTYLVPVFVQELLGYTATQSGLVLMPAGLAMAAVFPPVGHLTDRVMPQRLVMLGLALFAFSSALLAGVDMNTAFWTLAIWILIGRVGLGLILPPVTAGSLDLLPGGLLPHGSGAINFSRQLGGAFGVNLLAIFLDERTRVHTRELIQAQTPGTPAAREATSELLKVLERAGVPDVHLGPGALHVIGRGIHGQGYVMGFQDSFMLLAAVFVLALVPALVMGRYVRRHRHEGQPYAAVSE
ncbi:DHA2 family efflux MFS transporter permease subunit [Ectothiorhodospiraceae bacterium WFHF3C12]|nr:DHA2 family efflux MFS transporter permease subunit [Ectothiorhodospiraceae bacterium WFHF3C12]